MALFLKFKKLDIETGSNKYIVVLNEKEAENQSIFPGDKITLQWRGQKKIVVEVNLSDNLVKPGQVGIYEDVWKKFSLANKEIAEIHLLGKLSSIQAIKKRIYGSHLSQLEMDLIIDDIVAGRLDNVPIAFFIASSFVLPYSAEELYYLTKSMAYHGDVLKFPKGKTIVDLHSVGGVAGNRTTLVVIPIVASLGLTIPKTFSRAITSPAGTADTMEVLAPVTFTSQEMKKIVDKVNACLVWGGGVNLAPADDHIIKVTYRLSLDVYDKMIASIMAKKVAAGITHLVLDMPIGLTTKIPDLKKAVKLKVKFEALAKKFGMGIYVDIFKTNDPIGQGVGPALEARDVLRVLQQKQDRPLDLEKKSIALAGNLLEMVKKAKPGQGRKMAQVALTNGAAWKKMQEIIKVQGGQPNIDSEEVIMGAFKHYVNSSKAGRVTFTNNKGINDLARILGAPMEKMAGLYLNKEFGDPVKKGERLFTLYAQNEERLGLAIAALKKIPVFTIG